ncbi:hypothetical protein D3C81_1699570 [compost metagenome]
MLAAEGVKGVQADRFVALRIVQHAQEALLPAGTIAVLLKTFYHFSLVDPAEQLINILKMIIKGVPGDTAICGKLLNSNFGERPRKHQFFQ